MPLNSRCNQAALSLALALCLLPALAFAFGPQGHLIAGRVAAGYLCRNAVAEVGRLGDGDGLDELGLWADRIRGTDAWRHTAPWHYMNIADDAEIRTYRSPPGGDVLSALEDAHRTLAAEPRASPGARRDALRFLIHMLVDLHQPLHVGRADDRGGNRIDVVLDGERLNLHRFWDTESITTGTLGVVAYSRSIADDVSPALLATSFAPREWAAESLALRSVVYGQSGAGADGIVDGVRLDPVYVEAARLVIRERLTLAAGRLAATLNGLFCG